MAGRLLRRVAAALTPAPETQEVTGTVAGFAFVFGGVALGVVVALLVFAAGGGLAVGLAWRLFKWIGGIGC